MVVASGVRVGRGGVSSDEKVRYVRRMFGAIAPRWEGYFGQREQKVKVELEHEVLIGKAKGIDSDGALIVQSAEGVRHRIIAGDVTAVKD